MRLEAGKHNFIFMLSHLPFKFWSFLRSPPAKPSGKQLSLAAHVQSHWVATGPVSNSGCLGRTIWAARAAAELSAGHPQSPASDSPKTLLTWGVFAISGITHGESGLPRQLTASQIILVSKTCPGFLPTKSDLASLICP